HRDRRARARLGEGLDAYHRGHYERAEKLLAEASTEEEIAAGARLAAARAAIARGDHAAARTQPAASDERHAALRAIALAELALEEHRPTDALVALDAPAAQPLPPRGLALRAQALAANGQAAQAYGLLGTLRQQQALPATRLDELQEQWAEAALREAADANVLAERWESMPKSLRTEPGVVGAYAERAAALRWEEAATRSLEQALDARWDEGLAERYGSLPVGRIAERRAARAPGLCECLAREPRGAGGRTPRARPAPADRRQRRDRGAQRARLPAPAGVSLSAPGSRPRPCRRRCRWRPGSGRRRAPSVP